MPTTTVPAACATGLARATGAAPATPPRATGATPATMPTRLRAPGRARPVVDPGLAGGLRAWLEDVAATCARTTSPADPLLVTTSSLAHGEGRGGGPATGQDEGRGGGPAAAQGVDTEDDSGSRDAIARALFLLVVSGGEVRHPLDDAMAVLAADGRGATVANSLRHASGSRRAARRREAALLAGAIAEQWPPPPAAWLPRLDERLRVPLAGGRVLLAVTADLALGGPAGETASVSMVEVRATPPGVCDHRSRRLLALAETLRSGAPPLRVATYHPATGDLCCDDVSEELLALAVDDVSRTLPGLAAGGIAAGGIAAERRGRTTVGAAVR